MSECEFPGCKREVTSIRPQRSGDVLRVCGQPHGESPGECGFTPDGDVRCTMSRGHDGPHESWAFPPDER